MVQEYRSRPRDEAAELIECYIAEKGLTPHQKLPSERKICEMWGFNRTTLRSAIRKLIVEGKLYSKLGSGTFVAPPKLERNLQDMELMNTVAKRMGRVLTSRVLTAEVIEANKRFSKKLQVPLGHKIFTLSRLRIVDDIPTLVETGYVDYALCPGVERYDFSKESLYDVLNREYGVTIVKGQESLNITYTTEDEAELLEIEPGTAVFYLSGVSCDASGKPVEYFKSVVRSDQIRFSSVLTR